MAATGTMSTALANMLLDASLGGTFTPPTDVYLALCTSLPALTATGLTIAEPGGTWSNYGRVAVTASFGAATSRKKTSTAIVDFGTATTTANVSITHWAIVSSASGDGIMYWLGAFDGTLVVQNTNPVKVETGRLVLEVLAAFGAIT